MTNDYRVTNGELQRYDRNAMVWATVSTRGDKFLQKVKQQITGKYLIEVQASANDGIANFQTEKKAWSVKY